MSSRERILKVSFVGDAASLARTNQVVERGLGGVESKAASSAQKMQNVGGTLTRTLTPAAAAAGYAFKQAFDEADAGLDSIRASTGATGKELVGLGDSMKNVGARVTAPLSEVGQVLGEVNQRTGATGRSLETLTANILNLNNQLNNQASVEQVTRVFGDWNIATDQQVTALDGLYRASQATGPSVDALAAMLVRFGAPLRQMGFDLEQSTALLGKFENEGVNTNLVVGSLRIALGRLSKEGVKDIPAEFERLVQSIKNAGSAGEANAMALELFGSRAGPDMAAAIREGRFDIGKLFDQIAGGKETVQSATADTIDWGDKLLMLKNRVQGVIGPVGEIGFAVSGMAVLVGPLLTGLGKGWQAYARHAATARAATAASLIPMNRMEVLLGTAATSTGIFSKALGGLALGFLGLHVIDKATESFVDFKKEWEDESFWSAVAKHYDEKIEQGGADLDLLGGITTAEKRLKQERADAARGMAAYSDRLQGQADAHDEVTQASYRTANQTRDTGKEVRSFVGMTLAEFDEWRAGSREAFNGVSGVLDRLAGKADLTADQIINAFTRQVKRMNDYEDNWRKLLRRGLPDSLAQQLQDMGLEGAGFVEVLAKANDKEFEKIIRKWLRAKGVSKDIADAIVADLDRQKGKTKDYSDEVDRVPNRKRTRFETPGLSAAKSDAASLYDTLKGITGMGTIRAEFAGGFGGPAGGFGYPVTGGTSTAAALSAMAAVPGPQSITSGYRPWDKGSYHSIPPPLHAVDIGGVNLESMWASLLRLRPREMILDHMISENGSTGYYAPSDHTGENRHLHFMLEKGAYFARETTGLMTMAERGIPEVVSPEPTLDRVFRRVLREEARHKDASPTFIFNFHGPVFGVDDLEEMIEDGVHNIYRRAQKLDN